MARPERHDVDYFPFYVKDGKTLFILESKYGCKGTGFFTNVMRFLCLQPDHHVCIEKPSDRIFFFAKTKCDEEAGMDMLNLMSETGKISQEMWVSYKVIVSEALLGSIKDAYRNRKNQIITIDQIQVSYKGNQVSNVRNPQESVVSDANNPQKKLKEKRKNNPLIPLTEIQQDQFNRFWKAYPRKKSKGQAEKAWLKINPDEQLLATMIATIERAKTSVDWVKDNGEFIPYPATWLNVKGWEDEYQSGSASESHAKQKPSQRCQKCEGMFYHLVRIRDMNLCPSCAEKV